MITFLELGTEMEIRKFPKATLWIIFITSIFYLLSLVVGLETLILFMEANPLEPYNLSTPLLCTLVHGDFAHYFFNMLVLFVFGTALEQRIGAKKLVILYLIGAYGAFYFSAIVDGLTFDFIGSIGASGAISAVLGAFLVRLYHTRIIVIPIIFGLPIPRKFRFHPVVIVLVGFAFQELVLGILNSIQFFSLIGHWAHIGGFLTGVIFAFAMGYNKEAKKERLWQKFKEFDLSPQTGVKNSYEILKQILEIDPKDEKATILLADYSARMEKDEESKNLYRTGILLALKNKNEDLVRSAYLDYFKKFQGIFIQEVQLEIARILLKDGHFLVAKNSLELLKSELERKELVKSKKSLYIRTCLIIAFILDYYEHKFLKAREVLQNLLDMFPSDPMLKFVKERIANDSKKEATILWFNPKRKSFPFVSAR